MLVNVKDERKDFEDCYSVIADMRKSFNKMEMRTNDCFFTIYFSYKINM